MGRVALAKSKWARKVKGSAWKAGVSGKEAEFCKGVAEFLGVGTCKSMRAANYAAGTGAVTAGDFDSAVSGKQDRWERRYREAMG